MGNRIRSYRLCDDQPFGRPVMSRFKALVTSCVIVFSVLAIIEAVTHPRVRGKLVTSGYQKTADLIKQINDF